MNEQVIRALIAKWRDAAVWEHDDMSNVQSAQTFDQCADELEALLAAGEAAETSRIADAALLPPSKDLTPRCGVVGTAGAICSLPPNHETQQHRGKDGIGREFLWPWPLLAASLSPSIPPQEPTATPAPAPHPAPAQSAASTAPSTE